MAGTVYPNREHQDADEAARRRALAALDDIQKEAAWLRKRIAGGFADGDDTSTFAERAADVIRCVGVLGAFRQVRAWHAAGQAATAAGKE